MEKRNQVIDQEIRTIVDTVKQSVRLRKMYLFGSYAYGTPHEDSDMDFCIVADSEKNTLETLRDIRVSLFGKAGHPLDLLLFTPEEFSRRSQIPQSLEWQISHEGISVYG